ncbi:MAG: potassium channel family protein [Flavobacteriales bacterium]|jgi:trk system potassium uptake protein TrkA|tara:strand:- start:469 stop:1170 length:702 start_codon:yes stop_codon:yes gene_type:complete
MTDKFAVIGLGHFGSAICRKLSEKGAEVLAIDIDEDKVESIKNRVAYSVRMDATDLESLRAQKVQDMDAVVVSIGQNFEGTMLTVAQLMELNVKRIIARAHGKTQRRILKKLANSEVEGVDMHVEILSPEEEVGNNMAERLMHPSFKMCIELPDDYEIVEVEAPKLTIGRTIKDIDFLNKYQLNLVTLIEKGDDGNLAHVKHETSDDTIIEECDELVVFGKIKDVERFIDING